MEVTKGRVLYPRIMASVEVPYNVKEEGRVGVREQNPLENFLTTAFKY